MNTIFSTIKKFTITAIAVTTLVSLCSCNDLSNSTNQTQSTTQSTTKQNIASNVKINTLHSYKTLKKDASKELYNKIDSAANQYFDGELIVDEALSDKEVDEVVNAYSNDHPEVFWLHPRYSFINDYNYTSITLSFLYSKDEFAERKKAFDLAISNAVKEAPQNATPYEREVFINDYICNICEYDNEAASENNAETITSANNASGVFIEKKAVCEGYSKAFKILCDKLNVECVLISGKGENSLHEWNNVKLDNEWYAVDVTWNDTANEHEIYTHCYLNLDDKEFNEKHTPAPLFSQTSDEEHTNSNAYFNTFVPKCNGTKYNYFTLEYPTLTNLDNSEDIINSIAKSIDNKESFSAFLVDKSLDYNQTADAILNDYAYNWIEKANSIAQNNKVDPACTMTEMTEKRVIFFKLKYE